MHAKRIGPADIRANWSWMLPILAKAIDLDDERDPDDVFSDLVANRMVAHLIAGGGVGIVVSQQTRNWLWIVYAAGHVDPPVIARMQALMAAYETMARKIGTTEIHLIGRCGWSRVLASRGFETVGDVRGRAHVRKVL